MSYKLGSLFDGSGGFPLSGVLCGMEPVWAAEIEPYPIAVTRSRFPNMKHLGDISKIHGAEIEPVDVITFGSPCQDLSVAGKRAGLKHAANGDEETTRSGLFMEAVRIIKEMREKTHGEYPRYAIWENVPGAFSSNKGEDFRIVLEELIKITEPSAVMPEVPQKGWNYADSYIGDGWSLAYRVFDAQYWGVAQRRRRIYLVADFRGGRAREILFEREGLRGYFTQGRTPWEEAPSNAERSLGADDCTGRSYGGHRGRQLDGVNPLSDSTFIIDNIGGQAEYGKESPVNGTLRAGCQGAVAYVPFCKSARGKFKGDAETWKDAKVANTLNTFDQGESRANELVVETPVICLQGNGIDRADTAGCNGKGWKEDTCYTLNTIDRPAVAYGLDRASFNQGKNAKFDFSITEEQQPTLTAKGPGAVCTIGLNGAQVSPTLISRMSSAVGTTQDNLIVTEKHEVKKPPALCCTTGSFTQATEEVSPTLMARDWKDPTVVCTNYIVRRLTPTECARLQGFPDRWGNIDRKKSLTEEEYKFWLEVRNTHAAINGKAVKDYTASQMLTWYRKLHSDASEYKMWGNGIALPTALYVVQGIAEALKATDDNLLEDWML